jgi:DNA repair exonuclease SbcCD ATPase subunit
MSEPVFFKRVTIEAFRGFRDSQGIDLDASVVILEGPNGTGKTSFFDALQWLLLGRIERLESLRQRRNEEHIVNYYRRKESASVVLDFRLDGHDVTVRRVGKHDSSLVEWTDESGATLVGSEAEAKLEELSPARNVTLSSAVLSSALLQQDAMRQLLEASASERYKYLADLLGLQAVEDFEQASREHVRQAADLAGEAEEEVNRLEADRIQRERQVASIETRLRSQSDVDAIANDFQTTLEAHATMVRVRTDPLRTSRDARLLVEEVQGFLARLPDIEAVASQLAQDRDNLSGISEDAIASELGARRREVSDFASALSRAKEDLAGAVEEEGQLKASADAFVGLAAAALPLLGDTCPVCGQSIDKAHVEAQLRERAQELDNLVRAEARRSELEAAVSLTSSDLARAEASVEGLQQQLRMFADLRAREERLRREIESLISDASAIELLALGDVDSDRVLQTVTTTAAALTDLRSAAERLAVVLAASEDARGMSQLRTDIDSLRRKMAQEQDRLLQLRSKEAEARQLQRAATESAVRVLERRFSSLRPLISDIYQRLDPHPAFKILSLENEMYRARGASRPVALDPTEESPANPLLVFSTSQANIVALSFFLALGWAAGATALPFVLLDDPLQSLDDVNVLGLADLCRFVRARRQLIIATHEERFAGLLRRKLAPRTDSERTITLRFEGWDRSGPLIRPESVPGQHEDAPLRLMETA